MMVDRSSGETSTLTIGCENDNDDTIKFKTSNTNRLTINNSGINVNGIGDII